jgi:hypothetical protein
MFRAFFLTIIGAALLCAQPFALPKALEDELSQKAEDVTEVTLDATMLGFAKAALSSKGNDATARRVLDKLKGVYIRVFEFNTDNAYTPAQLEPLRAQLNQASWKKLVNVRSKKAGENVEIFMRMENGANTGLTVIAGERRELAIIHIDGPLDLAELGRLGGNLGIPDLSGIAGESDDPKPPAASKKEE